MQWYTYWKRLLKQWRLQNRRYYRLRLLKLERITKIVWNNMCNEDVKWREATEQSGCFFIVWCRKCVCWYSVQAARTALDEVHSMYKYTYIYIHMKCILIVLCHANLTCKAIHQPFIHHSITATKNGLWFCVFDWVCHTDVECTMHTSINSKKSYSKRPSYLEGGLLERFPPDGLPVWEGQPPVFPFPPPLPLPPPPLLPPPLLPPPVLPPPLPPPPLLPPRLSLLTKLFRHDVRVQHLSKASHTSRLKQHFARYHGITCVSCCKYRTLVLFPSLVTSFTPTIP